LPVHRLGNATSGFEQGRHFHGLLDVSTNIDLQKPIGWNGQSFHINMYMPQGTSITLENVGTIAAVSHIEAPRQPNFSRLGSSKASSMPVLRFDMVGSPRIANLPSSTAPVRSIHRRSAGTP
jgi:hypothetical protein